MRSLNQAGDTIVEVLIATAVVGMMLTGAFAISNASLKQIRMSQERSEAHRIAASQLELLKQSSTSVSTGCLVISSGRITNAIGPACNQGIDNRYRVNISSTALRAYSVSVTWDNLAGSQDNVTVDYRVEQ